MLQNMQQMMQNTIHLLHKTQHKIRIYNKLMYIFAALKKSFC